MLRSVWTTSAADSLAHDHLLLAPLALRSEIFACTLAAGIEIELVRSVIRRYAIPPPAGAGPSWPWLLTIRTLGRFEVHVEDKPLVFGRKLPRKALSLLKLVAAHGPQGIAESKAIDTLWADEDGDRAYQSLTSTIYRLRRLLGAETVLLHRGGRVLLDPERCWVDVWEPPRRANGASDGASGANVDGEVFLPDDDEPWVLPMRDLIQRRTR